jgi:hypothetical protein
MKSPQSKFTIYVQKNVMNWQWGTVQFFRFGQFLIRGNAKISRFQQLLNKYFQRVIHTNLKGQCQESFYMDQFPPSPSLYH